MQSSYLDSLHSDRWCMVRVTTGKGLEISDNPFLVLPLAVKVLREDDARYPVRFLAKDFSVLDEVQQDALDYIFITEPEEKYITEESIKNWSSKIKVGGHLVLHRNNKFEIYTKTENDPCLEPWIYPSYSANNVAVIRYGAYGDLLQCSSVLKGLKDQGYHVTLYVSPPGSDAITHDPNIDEIVLQTRDQVRNNELGLYWDFLKTKHPKVINLCESVERTWLAKSGDIKFTWDYPTRHRFLNENYNEFQHQLAGVKHKLQVKFYPTLEEIKWAKEERSKMARKVIVWSLSGSSLHKTVPWLDEYIARVMTLLQDVDVVLVGGPETVILQSGWQNEARVHKTAGVWTIRQSLTFAQQCADLVVGPETGILNSMACERTPKIVFLSHSTVKNLTRDWKNCYSMVCSEDELKKCDHCCLHRLHANNDGWRDIKRDEETGTAHCQSKMNRAELWKVTVRALGSGQVY